MASASLPNANTNCSDDYAMALALQSLELGGGPPRPNMDDLLANQLQRASYGAETFAGYDEGAMNSPSSSDGTMDKAWKFVEAVIQLHKETRGAKEQGVTPIAEDDMVALAERMFVAQQRFLNQGISTKVDIGYHYTQPANLERIQADGLLNQKERKTKGVQSNYNGSKYGEGIYTGNDPQTFQTFGSIGLIVARLKGEEMDVETAGKGYTKGNNSITSGNLLVLQDRFQCLGLSQFPTTLVGEFKGSWLVRDLHFQLQKLVDEFFNGESSKKPSATQPQCVPDGFSIGAFTKDQSAKARRSKRRPNNKSRLVFQAPNIRYATRTIHYQAPQTLISSSNSSSLYSKLCFVASEDECVICLNSLREGDETVRLHACRHEFHQTCAHQALSRSRNCPICRKNLEEPQGCMPSGSMTISFEPHTTCDGFSLGTIVVRYVIPSGIQQAYHELTGNPHGSANRIAYVPDTWEGHQLVGRLEYAFSRGLTFMVGTSLTSGRPNSVTWSSIHHKTSTHGSPHGFPDPNFFINCNADLDALGVPASHSGLGRAM